MKTLLLSVAAAAAIAVLAPAVSGTPFSANMAFAKHGADDTQADDRGGRGRGTDDGPNHTMIQKMDELMQLARRGADDTQQDDRGGRGRGTDDGPNHT